MKTTTLIFAIVFLLLNLKKYSNLFRSNAVLTANTKKILDDSAKWWKYGRESLKGMLIFTALIGGVIQSIFYVISANIIEPKFAYFIGIALAVLAWGRVWETMVNISKEEAKRNVFNRLLVPITSGYILYVIYYIVFR